MIFLHSSFRVSSTWLWSRFRRSDKVVAYCEVFNEGLATIVRSQLNDITPTSWYSKHPIGAGYFLEFLPFIRDDGGVNEFDAAMSFARFIPPDGIGGTLGASEQKYVMGLIAHAERLGKLPVLSASRSLGRLRSIKAAFPGFHILVYRNLFQQWCSYTEQCFSGNPYFFSTIRNVIEENKHDHFCRYLHDLFPLHTPEVDSVEYFCCFVLLHLYLYAQIADATDLIIDVNRLANDEDYRHLIGQRITDASGVEIDLSDAINTIAFSFVPPERRAEVLDQLRVIANLVIADAPSPQGRALASKVLGEFVEEYSRYHFYASRLVEVAGSGGLLGERDSFRAERDGLAVERDSFRAERDGLAIERDSFRAERDGLAVERDSLRAERDGLAIERDSLRAERDGLAIERDSLRAERDGLAIERASLRAERDCLAVERDSFRAERDGLAIERDSLRAERDGLAIERNGLLESTSWRLTAPIRALRKLLRVSTRISP